MRRTLLASRYTQYMYATIASGSIRSEISLYPDRTESEDPHEHDPHTIRVQLIESRHKGGRAPSLSPE
jgi:hypothetical protein